MKYFTLLSFAILALACGTEKKENVSPEAQLVMNFLADVTSLDSVKEANNPISTFCENAGELAIKTVTLTKENVGEVLVEMKEFNQCVITTGNHTIVKIIDPEDCKQSGSWGHCMPMAEGYIKKGALSYQKDYINNIIGTPDDQERIVYLFN